MIGASRLNAATYEQVESDKTTGGAAVFIVLTASFAAAVGAGLRTWLDIAGLTFVTILSWLIWVAITYFIGTRILPSSRTDATIGEVLRTTGFSASPGILRIFGILPGVGVPIIFAVNIWMLFAFVVAVRQALDYASSMRALAVCVLGWLIHGLLLFVFVMRAI
jgi:hypothetical protein